MSDADIYDTKIVEELAACLRTAVGAMEILLEQSEARLYYPGLPALIKLSELALKEYDK